MRKSAPINAIFCAGFPAMVHTYLGEIPPCELKGYTSPPFLLTVKEEKTVRITSRKPL